MFRGFVYKLVPTPEQAALMAQFADVCRLIWNLALEQRRDHWRRYQAMTGNTLTYVTQARELTALRAEVDFVRAVHVTPQQRTLKALDEAFRRVWQGLGGYPKPKKKGVGDAFSLAGREVAVETINRRWGRVRLPKIGWVRFRMTRPIKGAIREATLTRTALGWQVSIGCLIDAPTSDNGLAVGIDRGVTVPLMLSDGTAYRFPPEIERHERAIRRAQRTASRRKRGSRRWTKAQRRVADLKARQARARKHWAHETTTAIARRYSSVVVERLRTRDMTRSARATIEAPGNRVAQKRGLNRAILNVGWHQIETMLAYKVARLVRVDPAWLRPFFGSNAPPERSSATPNRLKPSQTCVSCGTVDSRSRESQAVFVCTACGHRDNADRNAAVVILNRGSTPGVEAAGCGAYEAHTVQAA